MSVTNKVHGLFTESEKYRIIHTQEKKQKKLFIHDYFFSKKFFLQKKRLDIFFYFYLKTRQIDDYP